jgi:pimeloyl-ACP methyl ester carboxylesterase
MQAGTALMPHIPPGETMIAKVRLTLLALLASTPAIVDVRAEPLTIESQGSFFIGGHEVKSDTLSTIPAYAPSGTITVGQMYVHYQIPVAATHVPVTFIHGCCLTGKTWETTPDGRMGWDEYFVHQGFPTYVIDQVSRGRSAIDPAPINAAKLGKTPVDKMPAVFSAGHEAAWAIFRFGPEYPKVFPGMKFPLQAQEEFWKQMVADWAPGLPTPNPTVPALSELAIRLKGTVLISHSQSGFYPFQTAALNTQDIAGIVSIEPGACPAATGDLTPYMKMPILVLFGDYVELSPRWAPRLKQCREFAEAMKKAGGRTELVVLPDLGIKGNSHMLMQDSNSLELAAWLVAWLNKNVPAKP